MKEIIFGVILMVLAILIAACSPDQPPQSVETTVPIQQPQLMPQEVPQPPPAMYVQPGYQQPIVVNSGASHDNSMLEGALLGGMLGHAIGSNSRSNYHPPQQTVVHKTYVNKPISSYRPSRSSYSSSFSRRR